MAFWNRKENKENKEYDEFGAIYKNLDAHMLELNGVHSTFFSHEKYVVKDHEDLANEVLSLNRLLKELRKSEYHQLLSNGESENQLEELDDIIEVVQTRTLEHNEISSNSMLAHIWHRSPNHPLDIYPYTKILKQSYTLVGCDGELDEDKFHRISDIEVVDFDNFKTPITVVYRFFMRIKEGPYKEELKRKLTGTHILFKDDGFSNFLFLKRELEAIDSRISVALEQTQKLLSNIDSEEKEQEQLEDIDEGFSAADEARAALFGRREF